ncbi:MAG: thioredoxin domain-containing protein [Chloroflexota bacterium]
MSRLLIICIILGSLLVGCAGQPTPAATESQGQAASRSNFVASDPEMVRSTGRPQVIVFFTFAACDVCQSMRPVIHALEDQYGTQADFIYLDTAADNTKAMQKDLAYAGQPPTFIFLSADGNEMDRLVGLQSRDTLVAKIDGLFAVG